MADENDQELLCPSLGANGGAYGKVRLGKKDPYHGFLVKKLIYLEPTCVIYLTEDDDLWWCSTDANRCATEYMRQIESELIRLKSVPIHQLSSRHKQYINELAGTGLEGFLGCEDKVEELEKAANEAVESIKEAKEYAIARNREHSRKWYTLSSFIALVTVLVLVGLVLDSQVFSG